MPILILILIFVIGTFGYIFYAYNRLTQLRNTAETEWAQVDTLLQKRWDLVLNIVEVVKGYAKHERDTLERIARVRTEALVASGKSRAEGEKDISSFVASIMALREQYPDLKANQLFTDLQSKLYSLEEDIARRRSNYNDIVKAYNDFVFKFPGSVAAALAGFAPMDYFEFLGSREAPQLDFKTVEM